MVEKQNGFSPPVAVRNAARRGMRLREEFNRGGINANFSLAEGDEVPLSVVRRMANFFRDNVAENRPADRESDGGPTAGTINWLLWGGNAGRSWANSIIEREEGMDKRAILHAATVKHNAASRRPSQRTTLEDVVKVYERGSGDFKKGPQARVNAFFRLLRTGSPGNPEYTQDNDLLPITHKRSTRKTRTGQVDVLKVDEELGIVFGYAIVCQQDGQDYYDVQGDHIPEHSMLRASAAFMAGDRVAKDMHRGESVGQVVFGLPLTQEIADSIGVGVSKTGLVIGMKPEGQELLNKYRTGEYTGFSIGGKRITDIEVD